jgi:hypothetical protein
LLHGAQSPLRRSHTAPHAALGAKRQGVAKSLNFAWVLDCLFERSQPKLNEYARNIVPTSCSPLECNTNDRKKLIPQIFERYQFSNGRCFREHNV